ncbi:YbaL family putative K(+) efflux transporter [Prosthecomicrobium sp. N25]|uniref:YbaL family putative K(+) efflux transporter n=1 Tax=Prosthecomicrobium sp. N25 TaxID=3129254 RepID=UPI003077E6FC
MPHDTPLISTIAIGLGLAFALGLAVQRLKLPPIVGYLAAGVVVGPFTPGYVADQKLAVELAEIGVILLMFGVGLHFSLKDLLSVRAIAIPGAIGQIAVASLLGMGLAFWLGWSWGAGLLFGLSLSVASTVVLLRALQERRQIETERGRVAVGWLIVEDLVMVLTLVLIPPLSGLLGGASPEAAAGADAGLVAAFGVGTVWATLLLTAVKVGLFVALMLVVGRKVIPWILHYVAHTGSRELFRLAVLAIALGVAYGSANLFGVSFALGAFFAGMVLAESQLSHQAARETLPLRDAFAVLFFVSVGMLFNPAILTTHPAALAATVLIIVLGKSLAAWLIVRAFGHPHATALTIAASLAQIGEFSFILIVLAVNLEIVPEAARDLVVAGSILSILINPLLFFALDRLTAPDAAGGRPKAPAEAPAATAPAVEAEPATALSGHAVLVGYGRVGSEIAAELAAAGVPFLVVDEEPLRLEPLKARGIEAYAGACGETALLERLNLAGARTLVSAIPDAFEAGHLVEAAKAANPAVTVIARAHSTEAADYLAKLGSDTVLIGEQELARSMIRALKAGPAGL